MQFYRKARKVFLYLAKVDKSDLSFAVKKCI